MDPESKPNFDKLYPSGYFSSQKYSMTRYKIALPSREYWEFREKIYTAEHNRNRQLVLRGEAIWSQDIPPEIDISKIRYHGWDIFEKECLDEEYLDEEYLDEEYLDENTPPPVPPRSDTPPPLPPRTDTLPPVHPRCDDWVSAMINSVPPRKLSPYYPSDEELSDDDWI
jgi:hypothetical protein